MPICAFGVYNKDMRLLLLFVVVAVAFQHAMFNIALLTKVNSAIGAGIVTVFVGYWLAQKIQRLVFGRLLEPHGKAVFITGCDHGFGHMLAKRLANQGFEVFAGCLNEKSEGAVALKSLQNIHLVQVDVTKPDQVDEAVHVVEKNLQDRVLWSVVANAGVFPVGATEWETWSNIHWAFNVNVFGAMDVSRKFLPLLRSSRGRLVIVASGFSRMTIPGAVPYCMTKHAVQSLADGLRRELQDKGVHVAAIQPVAYRTSLLNTQKMLSGVDNTVQQMDKELRDVYDDNELSKFKTSIVNVLGKYARSNLDEVVDQMELAIRDSHPMPLYKTGGFFDNLQLLLAQIVPTEWTDLFVWFNQKLMEKGPK
ncbi:short-chain dehydrogenase/reductase family 9C member 7-like [Ornithodoros turicata]|uniref:short-chain dehydrogenase/reductase family 9C member 7-like n=1 Tax=Ornithodoros turicata TaxID=34597 RepID=UPI00313A245D